MHQQHKFWRNRLTVVTVHTFDIHLSSDNHKVQLKWYWHGFYSQKNHTISRQSWWFTLITHQHIGTSSSQLAIAISILAYWKQCTGHEDTIIFSNHISIFGLHKNSDCLASSPCQKLRNPSLLTGCKRLLPSSINWFITKINWELQ